MPNRIDTLAVRRDAHHSAKVFFFPILKRLSSLPQVTPLL